MAVPEESCQLLHGLNSDKSLQQRIDFSFAGLTYCVIGVCLVFEFTLSEINIGFKKKVVGNRRQILV